MPPGSAPTLRTPEQLLRAGLIRPQDVSDVARVAERYAVAVSPAMAALIVPGDDDDPVARQFLPNARELGTTSDERADPIGDDAHTPVKGVVHRYPDRVLLKLLHACPVYCRFCFRREVVGPGGAGSLTDAELEQALAYIARNEDIFEVIMTGGDPLMLAPRRMAEVTRRLAAIPHVQVIRWHTRVPVVAPERVTGALLDALLAGEKAVYVALHVNHAREITPAAREAVARLANSGIALLSQTVLLRGVNADARILADLMRTLVAMRVKPYYLHHPDLAPGTSHFRLSIDEGRTIVAAMRGHISGLAQPTYVLDLPGGYGKVPIGPDFISGRARDAADEGDHFSIRDPFGGEHVYPPRHEP